MMLLTAIAFTAVVAQAPKPAASKCSDASVKVGGNVPGGGYSHPERGNEVVSVQRVMGVDASGHAVHIGYLYRTESGRLVFAGRTTHEVGVKNFDRVVKLYTDEGFPHDDAEDLVEYGPPILLWLQHPEVFLKMNALVLATCG